MRMISVLLLSAALVTPSSLVMAQTAPAAFTLTQDQLIALLAQCRANACAAGVSQLIAQARAANLSKPEFSAVVARIAATLVQATRNDSTLQTEVIAALNLASAETFGSLSDALVQVVALIQSGNIDDVEEEAVAQAFEPEETRDNGTIEIAPDAGPVIASGS